MYVTASVCTKKMFTSEVLYTCTAKTIFRLFSFDLQLIPLRTAFNVSVMTSHSDSYNNKNEPIMAI